MSAYHQDYGFGGDKWDSDSSGDGFSDNDWGPPPSQKKATKGSRRSNNFDWSDDFGAFDSTPSRSGYSPQKNSTDSFDPFDDGEFGSDSFGYGGYSPRSGGASWRKIAAAAAAVLLVLLCAFGIAGTMLDKASAQLSAPKETVSTVLQDTIPTPTPAPTAPQPTPSKPTQSTQPTETGQSPAVPSVPENRYHRSRLSAENQVAYDALWHSVSNYEERTEDIFFSNLEDINAVFFAVHSDWPEYFWLNTSSFRYGHSPCSNGYMVAYWPKYTCTAEQIPERQKFIDDTLAPIVSQLQGKSEFEKVVGVYSYLAEYYTYDFAYTGTTYYQNLRDRRAVCKGYADTTAYILKKLGMEVIMVLGEASDGITWDAHAWNIVKVDGKYYHLDTTWGDTDNNDGRADVQYGYCLIPTSILKNTHSFDEDMYPQCISMDSNYFVQNGLYMASYDEQFLTTLFSKAISTGECVCFMCSDATVYKDTISKLLDGGRLKAILIDLYAGQSFSYTCWKNKDTYTFALQLK